MRPGTKIQPTTYLLMPKSRGQDIHVNIKCFELRVEGHGGPPSREAVVKPSEVGGLGVEISHTAEAARTAAAAASASSCREATDIHSQDLATKTVDL